MRAGLRFLFTLEGRVTRRAYAGTGSALMAIKYAVEVVVIQLVAGTSWTPLDYFLPLYSLKASKLQFAPQWFLLALGLWTLPFLWIGASMTLRRARDAGLGAWIVVLFFAPLLNYAVMLFLALRPPRAPEAFDPWGATVDERARMAPFTAALVAVLVTAAGALAFASFMTLVARSYGGMLFLGLPFVLGFESAFVFNRRGDQGSAATLSVAVLALGLTGMALLLFAVEGIVCLAMAFPVAAPIAIFGAAFGRALALARLGRGAALAPALLLVPGALLERELAPPGEFAVTTALEIDAPRERVWPNVIGFGELPPPDHWLFATGIAYPLRAELVGEGVGAVRRCEFSTGAFVEPITAWEPPARLAFDVLAEPLPMEEWSFYARVRPPHLELSFHSLRGEFRLLELPGGRTRLEGTTWYRLELFPLGYWRLLSDGIVHRIHGRVLAHVKSLSERDSGARR
jgi:uncharacterized membrane protein YhaH (DUF805 family)